MDDEEMGRDGKDDGKHPRSDEDGKHTDGEGRGEREGERGGKEKEREEVKRGERGWMSDEKKRRKWKRGSYSNRRGKEWPFLSLSHVFLILFSTLSALFLENSGTCVMLGTSVQ